MIALIKVKKHIDLLTERIKKEELRDTKLKDFVKLPIKKQREELISEQGKILECLNLNNLFIMIMVKQEFERDDFTVEPHSYRNRKNIMRTYKGFQILIERKFEIFMHLILFRNIISKVWTEDFSQEVLICLVRAGMVIANIRIWRDFIISRDSDVEKIGGSDKNIRPKEHRTQTSGSSKGTRQLGKLEKTRFVKTADIE